jgi:glycosyltransferase involved in cell wall biosynthesis
MKTLNILMFCYYYPPLRDVGCKRSVAFSRYFKKYGWDPHVISVKNPDKAYCMIGNERAPSGIRPDYTYSIVNVYRFFGKINGLFARILRLFGLEVKRNFFYDLFCIPDIFFGWIPLSVLRGIQLIRDRHIDMVYVSCSPFSAGVIGVILKILTKKPLIVDFRDIYALDIESLKHAPSKMPFRKRVDSLIEKNILKWADLFVVTTEEMNKAYTHAYGDLNDKIFTVHNGFESKHLPVNAFAPKFDKFTISYAGNFYFEVPGGELFFEALASLQKEGKIDSTNFQFLYYGQCASGIAQLANDFQINALVHTKGSIPHSELLRVIRRSHLQLLRVMKPMISTKLFEGIALNISLLAIIPPGEVEQIIKRYSPGSYVVCSDSSEAVATAILDAMKNHRKGEVQNSLVDEFLASFSRENLTCSLMRIVEEKLYVTNRQEVTRLQRDTRIG